VGIVETKSHGDEPTPGRGRYGVVDRASQGASRLLRCPSGPGMRLRRSNRLPKLDGLPDTGCVSSYRRRPVHGAESSSGKALCTVPPSDFSTTRRYVSMRRTDP